MAANLTSAFHILRSATARMIKTGGGSIVLMSSAVAQRGMINHEAIAAAKAGVAGLALDRYTDRTITSLAPLEGEIESVRAEGYAMDNEEFLPGLFCLAVLVPAPAGRRSNTGIAILAVPLAASVPPEKVNASSTSRAPLRASSVPETTRVPPVMVIAPLTSTPSLFVSRT